LPTYVSGTRSYAKFIAGIIIWLLIIGPWTFFYAINGLVSTMAGAAYATLPTMPGGPNWTIGAIVATIGTILFWMAFGLHGPGLDLHRVGGKKR
jgi:hypothetical protein